MTTYLLDPDVCIDLLDPNVVRRQRLDNTLPDRDAAISIITYAEVLDGVLGSRDPERDFVRWRAFLDRVSVVGISVEIAELWAAIRGDLRRGGRLIPDSDLFIGATAIALGRILVTRNVSHFSRIAGLEFMSPRLG